MSYKYNALTKKLDYYKIDVPISYRVETGKYITIDDYEQLHICEQYIIEEAGTLNINGTGLLCIDGGNG